MSAHINTVGTKTLVGGPLDGETTEVVADNIPPGAYSGDYINLKIIIVDAGIPEGQIDYEDGDDFQHVYNEDANDTTVFNFDKTIVYDPDLHGE